MSYEEFASIALALPGVHEKVGKVECDLFRDGRHMARLRDRKQAIAFRLQWEMCDELLAAEQGIVYVTPHYQGHPYVLVKLKDLTPERAESLLQAAWAAAPEEIPALRTPRV